MTGFIFPSDNWGDFTQAIGEEVEENLTYYREILEKFSFDTPLTVLMGAVVETFGENLSNEEDFPWGNIGMLAYVGWLQQKGLLDVPKES